MQIFENETIEFFKDWTSGRTFSNKQFVGCHFVGCDFSSIDIANLDNRDLVGLRSVARNIQFIGCDFAGCGVGPGIVEECLIDGAKLWNHLQTEGTAFKHVTIRGTVNKLMITPYVDVGGHFTNVQRQFDEANRKYYESVDWALDISEGLFKDCDIRGVPAHLIKRDPETQVVLTREKALQGKWKNIDLSETHWPILIDIFLEDGYETCVLVAPKKVRNFKALLEGICKLRDAGIVEPN